MIFHHRFCDDDVNTTVGYPQAKIVLGCGGLIHPPTPLIEGRDRACRVDKSAAFLLYKEEKKPQSRVVAENTATV